MADIVPISPQIADTYREIRLRALHDDPQAFCASYAREFSLTPEDWHQRSASLDGKKRIGFVALEEKQAPCGLVCCFQDDHDTTRAEVISMWVSPAHRGTGLSTRLLDAIRAWAHSRSIATLQLGVISNNIPAIKRYERYGFRLTGKQAPHRNDSSLFEVEMVMATSSTRD